MKTTFFFKELPPQDLAPKKMSFWFLKLYFFFRNSLSCRLSVHLCRRVSSPHGRMAPDEAKSEHYAEHWGNWFKKHRPTEWHCTWDDVMGLAEPYLVHCASGDEEGGGLLVDLGCGQSQVITVARVTQVMCR